MAMDRWASFEGNSAPRAQVAPGTPCAPCTAKGHYCAAHEIVDGRAVCLHCLDGVPCLRTQRPAAPARPLSAAACLPDKAEAQRAIAVHEQLARAKVPAPVGEVALAQPALAPGATPSPAMPARRVFGRQICKQCRQAPHTGPCTCARCGGPRHRGSCAGEDRRMGTSKGTVLPKLSAPDAQRVVAEAREITAQVADEVQRRGTAQSKERRTEPMATKNAGAALYEVVDVSAVPGRKPASTYAEPVAFLRTLQVNQVMKRTLSNPEITHTVMQGIVRTAWLEGLTVSAKLDGATMYVWQRAK
jgi:hypothetical protein